MIQEGDKAHHPKHIYANPIVPELCPILALGIFLATVDHRDSQKLFEGSKQEERFRKFLSRATNEPQLLESLEALGFDKAKLGIHSTRKGAATHCVSGTTAAPNQASIDIRGGWSQGRIKDVYQHYLPPGDQYVGRSVCGLPRHSIDFAILPPRFKPRQSESFIKDAVRVCFPTLPDTKLLIGTFCLASLVHHSQFMRELLPTNHIIFSTPIYRNSSLLQQLKDLVISGHHQPEDIITPTGIPTDIHITQHIMGVPGRVDELLPERSIQANQVTPDYVRDLLNQNYLQMRALLQPNHEDSVQEQAVTSRDRVRQATLYQWGGQIRFLPADFDFPTVNTRIIWGIWCMGDQSKGWPPLKSVSTTSIPVSKRKRFSDLRYLMKLSRRS